MRREPWERRLLTDAATLGIRGGGGWERRLLTDAATLGIKGGGGHQPRWWRREPGKAAALRRESSAEAPGTMGGATRRFGGAANQEADPILMSTSIFREKIDYVLNSMDCLAIFGLLRWLLLLYDRNVCNV
jgi:hypothetical protein